MIKKLSNQFLLNYLIVFIISVLAALFAFLLLSFANDVISKTLVKNNYTANSIMKDDYTKINANPVLQNGGGVQVINKNYDIVYSSGIDTIGKDQLTITEFTNFLIKSNKTGVPYNYDIQYNSAGEFWLVVTFPTSIRLNLSLDYNKESVSRDLPNVLGVLISVLIFYLLLLALGTYIYSRLTALRITNPLLQLCEGTKQLREGDYSTRVNLNLKNEFMQLQNTFNDMATRIEKETDLRKKSEEERKKLILDVSHDLKNPLSSTFGYAELCLRKDGLDRDELKNYLQIIYNNSKRANKLLNDLFELSKLENPEILFKKEKTNICEYMRRTCAQLLPVLEQAGFDYHVDIPETTHYIMIDTGQMDRVFYNLTDNAIRYNDKGTTINITLVSLSDNIEILFQDNGVGIPTDIATDIFKPFVRVDNSHNKIDEGTGLGLSIVYKIIEAHGGRLNIFTDTKQGCIFKINLPII